MPLGTELARQFQDVRVAAGRDQFLHAGQILFGTHSSTVLQSAAITAESGMSLRRVLLNSLSATPISRSRWRIPGPFTSRHRWSTTARKTERTAPMGYIQRSRQIAS